MLPTAASGFVYEGGMRMLLVRFWRAGSLSDWSLSMIVIVSLELTLVSDNARCWTVKILL